MPWSISRQIRNFIVGLLLKLSDKAMSLSERLMKRKGKR
jgi:hypothetical protein